MNPSNLRRGFATTSLGQLHYRACGEGPTLVMMQTVPFSTAIFKSLMAVLAPHYSCYAIDLLGFSHSDPRPNILSVEDYATNLVEALDDLGIGRMHLLAGHFSGSVAVEIALRRPEQIISLMLDGMGAITPEEREAHMKKTPPVQVDASAQYFAGRWEYVEALMKRLDPELVISNANLQAVMERAFPFFFRFGGPGGETGASYDLAEKLPQLKVPTLFIASPTDTQRPWHERTFALVQGAKQHIFDGINPLYQCDRPDRAPEYAAVMTNFMRMAS
jgi:pimeloyl-ACP methyl ester carboxylesterase